MKVLQFRYPYCSFSLTHTAFKEEDFPAGN